MQARSRSPQDGWVLASDSKRSGESYYAELYDDGERVRRVNLRTADAGEAKRRLKGLAAPKQMLSDIVTIEAVMDHYVADRREIGKPVWRIESAARCLEPLGRFQPGQITRPVVRRYVAAEQKRGVSNGYIRTNLSYLNAALVSALRDGLIESAPHIEMPPAGDPRQRSIPREMAGAFLGAIKQPHARLFAKLALATAARPSHILELTWDRIDFEARTIDFRDPRKQSNNKGRPIVPMNKMAYEALREAHEASTGPYVVEYGGDRVLRVSKAIEAAGKRVGLHVTPYVLRHSAARWMAEDGVPMEEIAQYMGHSSIDTTRKHYARYSPSYLQKAANSLNVEVVES